MTEAAIFQFCGTPNNVHLETHPGVLGPGRIYHSLASSQISRPTYQHPARSNEKLGSLSWAGPVDSSVRGPPSSTNPPAAGVWLGSHRPRVSQWSSCDSIKATGGIKIPTAPLLGPDLHTVAHLWCSHWRNRVQVWKIKGYSDLPSYGKYSSWMLKL